MQNEYKNDFDVCRRCFVNFPEPKSHLMSHRSEIIWRRRRRRRRRKRPKIANEKLTGRSYFSRRKTPISPFCVSDFNHCGNRWLFVFMVDNLELNKRRKRLRKRKTMKKPQNMVKNIRMPRKAAHGKREREREQRREQTERMTNERNGRQAKQIFSKNNIRIESNNGTKAGGQKTNSPTDFSR